MKNYCDKNGFCTEPENHHGLCEFDPKTCVVCPFKREICGNRLCANKDARIAALEKYGKKLNEGLDEYIRWFG